MNNKKKQKIINDWIEHNGAAEFDLKNKDIILFDGGLFSIIKETKTVPKTRIALLKNKGEREYKLKICPIKRKGKILKEKREYYKASLWFQELDETILYFQRMKRMLQSLGYKTSFYKKR